MRRLLARVLLFLSITLPAQAGMNHGVNAGATGSAAINLGGIDVVPANFVNVLKTSSYGFTNSIDAGVLDADGVPASNPTGIISLTYPSNTTWNSTTYTLRNPGTRIAPMNFINGLMSGCTAVVNITVTGCSGGNALFQPTAADWSITFTVGAISGFSIQFPVAGTYTAGTGEIALYRTSDASRYAAGLPFTAEYEVTLLGGLNPKTIRPMGWVNSGPGNLSNHVKWVNRTKPTNLTWSGSQYLPNLWGGAISGTDALTIAAAPDTPGVWTANEMIQGALANPATSITISGAVNNGSGLCRLTINSSATLSTNQVVWIAGIGGATACNSAIRGSSTITVIDGTHIDVQGTTFGSAYTSGGRVGTQTLTVTGKSGGAKFIACAGGNVVLSCFDTMNAGRASFFFDAVLDRAIYTPNGIVSAIPIEIQVGLANRLRLNLWGTVPAYADDDYVTNWATVVRDNLNPALFFLPEYANEISFNTAFAATNWGGNRGLAFGFPAANNEHIFGWTGLRVRQIMGNLIPAVFSGQMSRLRRTLMFQGAGDSNILTFYMKGRDLAPSGTSTGIGNSVYTSFTGGADYTTKPNRPIDTVETIGYAPYVGGVNLYFGPDIGALVTPTAVNAPFYQALVDAWEGGNTAAAIALVDDDIRQGRNLVQTVTCSGTTFTTPLAHSFTTSTRAAFQVVGGTSCSGLVAGALYKVSSVPTPTTFTLQGYSGGFPSGANINAGSAGTGTVTVGWVGGGTSSNFQTMQAVSSNWYQFGEATAASFDSDRPAGMSVLRVEQYEGSPELVGPSVAQCTALGITGSTPSASIAAAITAWRNDPAAAATIQTYYSQFMGQDPAMAPTFGLMAHSKTPSHLVLPGPITAANPYALISGGFPNSAVFQLYNGFAAWRSGVNWLLERDINPASNDNSPMFLAKAA